MAKHNEFGKKGEQLAVDYLTENGYRVVHRNYRHLKAEIDIIARKGDILAIVEVKSRSSDYMQSIAETVTEAKIKRLVKATNYYVIANNLDVEVRFDIITIHKNGTKFSMEHLENAFYHF